MKKQDGLRAAAAILTSASSRAHVKAPDPHRWPQAPDPHTLDPHRQYSTDSAQQRSQANAGAEIRRIVQPPRAVSASRGNARRRRAPQQGPRRRTPREGEEERVALLERETRKAC